MSNTLTRAERTLATRRKMIRAAYELFCRDGYLGATISGIAERAGVAVPTIYYTFHTKSALLGEVLGAAIIGFDHWREPPPEPFAMAEMMGVHRWWNDFRAAPTSDRALGIFVRHGAGVLARVAPLVPALHVATGDPEAGPIIGVSEQRRVDSYREVVALLAVKPAGLREGLTRAAATDVLVALFSAETYQSLALRGWSHRRCAAFFADLLPAQLLDPGDRTRP